MAPLTPAQRKTLARLAANARWANLPTAEERRAATEAFRQGHLDKLADQIDPNHLLSDADRMEAAKRKRREHMARITAKSLASRQRKAAARKAGVADDGAA